MFRPSRPMMRPFISSFGSDDGRHRGLGGRVRRDALNGERDDLLRLALGVAARDLADLAQRLAASACASSSSRRISSALASCADMPAICSRRRRSSATSLSSSSSRVCTQLLAAPEVARALADLAVALLHELELAVERALALADAALLLLHRHAARAELLLGRLAELHHLFLAGDDRALARASPPPARPRRRCACAVSSAVDFAAACRSSSAARPAADARLASPEKEKGRRGDDERAQRGKECHFVHSIYAPPRRAAGEGRPPLRPRSAAV